MTRSLSITAVVLVAACLAGCIDYSDGARTGVITKFSRKGLICKTWEGEMNLGGLRNRTSTDANGNSSTSAVVNIWAFTVEDEKLIPIVQAKMRSGEVATVAYRQELVSLCRSDSGSYFATGVE